MAKTMTFEEILSQNPDIYWNTDMRNDEATQAIIYDWFRFRRVTSNNRFPLYFQRVINRDYTRYLQLLRIEAGKIGETGRATNYDWLVMDYLESLDESAFNQNTKTAKARKETIQYGAGSTTTNSGSDKSASAGKSLSHSEGNSNQNGAASSLGETNGTANAGQTTTAKAGSMARTTPMTQQYSQTQMDFGDDRRGMVVKTDDGYVVGEAEDDSSYPSGEVKGSIRALYRNFPELNIQNPTSVSDSRTINGSISDSTNHGDSRESSATKTNSNYTDDNNADTAQSNVTNYGRVITAQATGSDVHDGADSGISNQDSAGNKKHIHTGRNGEIAEILKNVIEFINKSSACDWYRSQLETCFMQCFDEEED